ncbi:hypothetical protein QOZ89_45180 [Pseudofrankia sp. BMG5.37]|nr:hypothetical protein [Pseudofrankia sp. BMG5.37]MDT3446709.1 hypothetical protein [Pseudofrankia sp. BMG5.37]
MLDTPRPSAVAMYPSLSTGTTPANSWMSIDFPEPFPPTKA